MSKVIQINAGEISFLAETDESINVSDNAFPGVPEGMEAMVCTEKITQELKTVRNIITACCDEMLNSIKNTTPRPDKFTVEFGIKFAGEGGIPTLAKASSEANLKISIGWKKNES